MDSFPSSVYASPSGHVDEEGHGHVLRGPAKMNVQMQSVDPSNYRVAFDDITNHREESEAAAKLMLVHPPQATASLASRSDAFQQTGLSRNNNTECNSIQQGFSYPSSTTRGPAFVDIDSDDIDDPMACVEYINDIFHHLRSSETQRRPITTYMETVQTDINSAMRSILIDWLVEVGQEYRLSSDTLFLSVAYIDRYLSLVDVKRSKLQLIGVTSMLIASKYEEIYAPQLEDFCYITDNTYSRQSVLATEREVLGVLEFELTQPTTKTFLRRFIKAASGEIPLDVTFEFLVSYLAELSLMEYELINYLPSHVAASCILLALYILKKPRWSDTLTHYSGYVPRDLKHCTLALHNLFVQAKTSNLPASREKYASPKFGCVSQFGVQSSIPDWWFQ